MCNNEQRYAGGIPPALANEWMQSGQMMMVDARSNGNRRRGTQGGWRLRGLPWHQSCPYTKSP